MKTIASRISRANSGDASEEDISKSDKAYKSIGISIRDANCQFQDLDTTLTSLSKVWGSLDSVQRSYIAEQSAGVRQKSIFIDMMNNYAQSTEMATEALNSQGLSEAKNDIYLTSINAKLKILGTTITTMFQQGISSDFIKGLLDGALSLVKTFGNLHTIISLVVTGLMVFKGAEILKFFTSLPEKIKNSVTSMQLFRTISAITQNQSAGLITANEAVALSFKAVGTSIKTAFLSNPLG
jgi:TP901 family phage tail tape measure protein